MKHVTRNMTDLDKKLQEMALNNWDQFVAFVGKDAINRAKACLLKRDGKSIGAIRQRLGITEDQARYAAKKCEACKE